MDVSVPKQNAVVVDTSLIEFSQEEFSNDMLLLGEIIPGDDGLI